MDPLTLKNYNFDSCRPFKSYIKRSYINLNL